MALQMLTDLGEHSTSLITIPNDLGDGVKLDVPMKGEDLRAFAKAANAKRSFRDALGGKSVSLLHAGHSLCEIQQWTLQYMKADDIVQFMRSLNTKPASGSARAEFRVRVSDLVAISWP